MTDVRHQLEELEHFVEEKVPFYLRRYWRWPAIAVAAIVVPVALGLWAFRFVEPYVPEYRADAEAFGTRALGWPVKIERMYLGWHWFGPEVVMQGVRVLAPDESRTLIRASAVRVGIAPGDFLRGGAFRPARVVFEAPKIAFDVMPDGKVLLAGEEVGDLTGPPQDWRPLLRQLLIHGRVEVQGGDFTWNDRRTGIGRLHLTPVDIAIESDGDDHELEAALALPDFIGASFAVELEAEGDPGAPESWDWQGRVDAEDIQVGWLQTRLRPGALYAATGTVDLEARAEAEDGFTFNRLVGSLSASQLSLTPKGRRAVFRADGSGVDRLAGDFDWRREDAGWRLAIESLAVQRGKRSWKTATLDLDYTPESPTATLKGGADFVRIEDFALMASWLPREVFPYTADLLDYAPNGDVRDLAFDLLLADETLADWNLKARVDGLGVARRGRSPGFDGLSGALEARAAGGSFTLDARNFTLDFGALFRKPLVAKTARGELGWQRTADGYALTLVGGEAANADGRLRARGTVKLPARGGPVVDLTGEVFDVDLSRKSPYLPVGIMRADLVGWLDRAVIGGRVARADYVLRGPLGQFPFRDGSGLFEVRYEMLGATLAYAADWPKVENVRAAVVFRNQGLEVSGARGTTAGMPFDAGHAVIADFRDAKLVVEGHSRADAERAAAFVRASPLVEEFGELLDTVAVRGPVDVVSRLDVPLNAPERVAIDVRAMLDGTTVRIDGLPFGARHVKGEVRFTEHAATAERLGGELLGAPFAARLATEADGGTRVHVEATGGVQPLAQALELPLGRVFSGAAKGTAELRVPPRRSSQPITVALSSDLVGLAIDLPAPLGKPEVAPLAARAELAFPARDRLELAVAVGAGTTGRYRFVRRGQAWHPAGDDAAHIEVAAPMVDAGAWLERVTGGDETPGFAVPFRTLRLRAERLDAWGQRFDAATVDLERLNDAWGVAIAAPAVEGTIRAPDDLNAYPVVADLQRLWLTPAPRPAPGLEPPAEAPPDPRKLPAVTLRVGSLRNWGADFGGVDATIEKRPWGLALTALHADGDGFTLDVNGRWEAEDGRQHTRVESKLHATDVRRALKALGFATAIEGNRADLSAALDWTGAPFDDPLPKLAGTAKVAVGKGTLLDVKPGGASRALGLFSLAALPRRLTLDFRDVVKQGLAFDAVKGDFLIDQGNAYTTNLRLESANLEMNLVGRTGLATRDYDQLATVDTSLGATLPVAGALAGGPAVAAAALIVSQLFKRTLADATRVHYRVTGTWDEPRIERATAEDLPP